MRRYVVQKVKGKLDGGTTNFVSLVRTSASCIGETSATGNAGVDDQTDVCCLLTCCCRSPLGESFEDSFVDAPPP